MAFQYEFSGSDWDASGEKSSGTPVEFPEDVDEITEHNNLSILEGNMSADEVVSDQDVVNVEEMIEQGRAEDRVAKRPDLSEWSLNLWSIMTRGAINLILPFVNGMMLGFGEILAHEVGFRYNFVGARVQPARRMERKNPADKFL